LKDAIARTVAWYQAARDGEDMGTVTLAQINSYAAATSANALTG
jgi:hypothetical protein